MIFFRLFAIAVALLCTTSIFAQPVDISVQVMQSLSPQAKLFMYHSGDFIAIDSSKQNAPGSYMFSLPSRYQRGVYKIEIGKSINFSIVVGNEPQIDIQTVVYAPEDSLKSKKSIENRVFWQYQKQKKRHKQQTWYIKSLMDYYADSSLFFKQLQIELNNQNIIFNTYTQNLTSQNKHLLASKFISIEHPIEAPLLLGKDEKKQFLIDQWWQNIDFFDTLIFNSPALQTKLWGYIELFYSDNLDKEEQDEAFVRGIGDFLCFPMELDVKKRLRDYLVEGFHDTDYEPVLDFLQYSKFGSLEPLKQMPKASKKNLGPKTKVGDKAFDFNIITAEGQKTKLSKVNAEYKLVLFWSSWCPHCLESMPRIKELYDLYKSKGFEVIAVSIDEDAEYWQRYISDFGLKWINIREDIMQDSELLYYYDVEETPKMFLLSRNLTIISRPSTKKQLETKLTKLIR
jgi:thiol-disulfide isomerase/thioredoxin